VTAVPAANPDRGNAPAYNCPRVSFEVEQNGRRVALEADAAQFLIFILQRMH